MTPSPAPLPVRRWGQYHLLTLLVLAASLAVTFQSWRSSEQSALRAMQASFDFSVREASTRVEQRMAAYEEILHSAEGFMSHADVKNREEFHNFVEKLRLDKKYPGLQGIAFAQIVPAAQIEPHLAAIRAEGFPDYAIKPGGTRALYAPVIYIEPFSGANLRAFGHDPYVDTVRRAAMDQARDLDLPVITGKVTLVQEYNKNLQAGFMMYLPVFKFGAQHGSIAERRAGVAGWIGAAFRMDDLMDGLHGEQAANIEFELFDGEVVSDSTLMYAPDYYYVHGAPGAGRFTAVERIRIANHTWTMQTRSLPAFEARQDRDSPRIVAGAGIGISLMLTLLTLMLVNDRERALQVAREMKRELIERETRYRQMFENNDSITYLLDPDSGRIVDANAAAAAFTGYPLEQLRTLNITAINTATREHIMQAMQQVREGGRIHKEWRHLLNNGEIRDVEVFSSPLDYHGKVLAYTIVHDISARKQAEQALLESELRWKFALDGGGYGVWDWNIVTSEVHFSICWKNILGYAEDEIENTLDAWEKLIHPDQKARVIAENQACLECKTPDYVSEYRMRCKDGSWKWILARGMVISRDTDGQALRMIGTHADITDRKQAEQRQVQKIVEAAPDPMLLIGNDGIIAFANRAAQSTFGYEFNELTGQNVDILVPFKNRSSHAHHRHEFEARMTGRPLNMNQMLTAVRQDGTEFPVEISLSRFQMDGEPVVITSICDITERKRAAQLLEQSFVQLRRLSVHQQNIKEVERKRIAQDIHDDLGQNLLVLKMDVTMLYACTADADPKLNELAGGVLKTIDAAIKSMKSIVNDLRPATLELGLYPAVEWQLKQFERISGIACKLVATAPQADFELDEIRTSAVFRILQEALSNVARHAQATEVEIRLSRNGRGFSMTVMDNGRGLEPVDRRKTNSFGLLGIKERVHSLEGELVMESSPGNGTVLSISIPLDERVTIEA